MRTRPTNTLAARLALALGASLVLALSSVSAAAPATSTKGPRAKRGTTRAALPTVSAAYRRVAPTVAFIETTGHEADEVPTGQLVTTGGIGSGVLISAEGHVLPAAHVVQTADKIRVRFDQTDSIPAHVVRSVPSADIALLKLEFMPPDVTPAVLADSDAVEVGEPLFIVGAPLGIHQTLTVGHISARREPDAMANGITFAELFQTDAAINQGNSGGPMFNMRGEVIGVVSHMISLSGSYEGLGFAVTSNAARALLMSPGTIWSGMRMRPLSGRLAELFNVPQPTGYLIERIATGSAGARLGLREGTISSQIADLKMTLGGDILLEVLGVQLGDRETLGLLGDKIEALHKGDPFTLKILRGGQVMTLNVPFDPELFGPRD
jgi:S1-C subfamily serine protease